MMTPENHGFFGMIHIYRHFSPDRFAYDRSFTKRRYGNAPASNIPLAITSSLCGIKGIQPLASGLAIPTIQDFSQIQPTRNSILICQLKFVIDPEKG
jgi:hypothetical protein